MSEEITYEPIPWGRIFLAGIAAVIVSLGLGAYIYSSISTGPSMEETIAVLEEAVAVVPDLTAEEQKTKIFLDYNEIVMGATQIAFYEEFGGELSIIGIRGPGIYDVFLESIGECQVMGTVFIDGIWLTFSLGLIEPAIVCLS